MEKTTDAAISPPGKEKFTVRDLSMCALFATLTAVGAFIKIPIPVVPFTLQFLFVMLAGLLLGARKGTFSVAVYVLLGLAGVPVFAEGGGFWYVLKPSFGYLIGFLFAAYVIGKITENIKKLVMWKILAANFAGLAIVYGIGLVYYYVICNYVIHTPLGVWPLFLYCFLMVVPGDICLCILAAILTKRVKPALRNMGY